ncbi:GNAT family N-acetyltransferase [Thalassotalea sp. HSM 43]|uniref:GNAT family N-acetyltransferase n=1 Tax=Thalassotalea sp. HSM 43 TaxID=2552945 RepID=UPI0010818E4B|nr:GNAT family N-acetyltransferase [Thalassotalea sp. HSM 43]QBY05991.1 GNAT family N-acetyltransferase [Thalassotalea sp. HSM 43]
MSNHNIRKAVIGDLREIQSIARRTIDKCYRSFLGDGGVDWYINSGESDKELEKHLSNSFVLEQDTQLLGFSIVFDNFIHLMMIDEKFHRSGLGKLLLTFSEAELTRSGNSIIKLETFEGNTQAINFYLKNNWVISKKEADPEFGFVRVFFEKNVNP